MLFPIYKKEEIVIFERKKEEVTEKLVIVCTGNIMDWRPKSLIPKDIFKNCTILDAYYTSRNAGLEGMGKELAAFIDNAPYAMKYKNIYLVAKSKCAITVATSLVNTLERQLSNVFLVSPPFLGTYMVVKEEVKRRIYKPVEKHKGIRKVIPYLICSLEYLLFCIIFGNYPIDHAISIYLNYFKEHYKEEKLKKHSPVVIAATCQNKNAVYWKKRGWQDCFLFWLDKRLNIQGDGIVPYRSMEYLKPNYIVNATHASVLQTAAPIIQKYINNPK